MRSINIADYELGDVLGVGTVGTVYACVKNATGESYALKRLHPSVSRDRLIRSRFEREMLIMQRLRHPNIVAYYGGGDTPDGSLFYVMELVDGGTVKDLLETNGPLPWQAVVELGRQICSALQCAHNNGVVHRDLKPGNLFLNRNADMKLGDFGIARDLTNSNLTSTGLTVGTHAYMAPEQITGDKLISGKVDLYALGCCLFQMLSGRTPFSGDNFAQLFEQHLRAKPPRVRSIVPACPPALDEIINQLLSKNPDDRPFNARRVQAVMMELGNQPQDSADADEHETDIGAGSVAERGRQVLIEEIANYLRGPTAVEVSWGKLAVIAAAIVAFIAAAVAFGE